MTKPPYLPALIAAAIIVLALALNPSPEAHRAKIKEVIAERSQLERVLGVGVLTAFASKYKSLGIFSYTTVNDQIVSFGVLGMVFFVQ